MIRNIFKDFFKFIKRPDDNQLNLNIREKIKFVSILLFFEVVFTLLVIFPLFEVIGKIEIIKVDKIDYSETLIFSFFIMVILVPLFEELCFRYILRYQGFKIKFITRQTWNKIFPFLVYFLSSIFGFIHLSNYKNEGYLFLLISPLIVLSQLIGGLIITFIRIRINFTWGVCYHLIWNFIVVIAVPSIEYQLTKPYIEINEKYKISITEKPFFNENDTRILKIDSVNHEIKKIEIKQYSLQNLIDTLYTKDKYYVDDVLIDLNYSSKEYSTKEDFLKILIKKYDIK
jgi:membrane protease YdiL (CAAX protease family)